MKQATYRLVDEIRDRLAGAQHGIPTAFDRSLLSLMATLARLDPARPWEESAAELPGPAAAAVLAALDSLRALHHRRRLGRYVRFSERVSQSRSEVPAPLLACLNGVEDVVRWKGVPLFKTPFDMVLLQMLVWDLQPRTIIELGSGLGASAAWLGDLLDVFGLPGRVYSFDLAPPDMLHPRVTFAATDLQRVATDFPTELLAGLDHPLLLIEDAHVNLPAVLGLFDRYMQSGDYLIVEDSAGKREILGRWLAQNNDRYLVDTRYVDFFGQNATSAQDSILVRI